MDYSLRYTDDSLDDLREIRAYLLEYSDKAENDFAEKFEKTVLAIKSSPLIYQCYEKNKKYRRFVVDSYVGFYRIDDQAREINIIRILHARRNISKIVKSK